MTQLILLVFAAAAAGAGSAYVLMHSSEVPRARMEPKRTQRRRKLRRVNSIGHETTMMTQAHWDMLDAATLPVEAPEQYLDFDEMATEQQWDEVDEDEQTSRMGADEVEQIRALLEEMEGLSHS